MKNIIIIPRDPRDSHIPDSIIHLPLGEGKFATIEGPLFSHSMVALSKTLKACKPSLVMPDSEFEI